MHTNRQRLATAVGSQVIWTKSVVAERWGVPFASRKVTLSKCADTIQTTGEQEANLNGGDPDERVIEEERDLNKEEEDILKAFRENDKELEDIAQTIVEELKKVKLNAENIEAGIDK